MPITGDLSHFALGDMIRVLRDHRKSGTLWVGGHKGKCKFVFAKGEIVGANYLNSIVRVGQVLLRNGALSTAELSWALSIQEQDPQNRKPLVLTFLENHMVERGAAHHGLKMLIEMTLVEVLSWDSGYFKFEEGVVANPGGWHYKLTVHQEASLNAQAALLQSLRIFDEKRRDDAMEDILGIVGQGDAHLQLVEIRDFQWV